MQKKFLLLFALFFSLLIVSYGVARAQYTPKVFTVVVGSLKYGSNAKNLVNDLNKKGIDAAIIKMSTKIGEMNRICVGSFDSNRDAQDASRILSSNYNIHDGWVLSLDQSYSNRLVAFNQSGAVQAKPKVNQRQQLAAQKKAKAEQARQKQLLANKKAKQKQLEADSNAEQAKQKQLAALKQAEQKKQKQIAAERKAEQEKMKAVVAKKEAEKKKSKANIAAAAAATTAAAAVTVAPKKPAAPAKPAKTNTSKTDPKKDAPKRTNAETKDNNEASVTAPADLKKFMRFYHDFADAMKNNDIEKMNKAVDPIFGVYVLYKPGKIVLTEKMKTFAAMKDLPFTTRTTKDLKKDLQLYTGNNLYGKIPEFDCGKSKYTKDGFFIDRIDGTSTNLTNVVNYSIAQTKTQPLTTQDIRKLSNIERSIKVAVRNTDAKVLYTMYFSFERGQWLLRIIDMTRNCD
jgi:chemotaxis protein histidine kinase CheA